MAAAGSVFKKLRRIAAVVAFIAMIAVGYFSMSAATSCKAEAQTCFCGICVLQGPSSVSATLTYMSGQVLAQITAATGAILANYTLATEAFGLQVVARFGQIILDVDDWFNTFWYYNQLPAMQAMVEQENVMGAMQAATISTYRDAAELARTSQLMSDAQLEALREAGSVSPLVCSAGSVAGGMLRADTISRAYALAAPVEHARRGGNEKGSSGESGGAGDLSARWQDYAADFCNPNDNNGAPGCTRAGTHMDADINVPGTVFYNDTIDMTDDGTRKSVDALVDNIVEPVVPNNIPAPELKTAEGKEAQVERDSYRARRQAAHDALFFVVGRRAPGGGDNPFVGAIRQSAGLTPDMISSNPSKNEIMQAMMYDRFRSGQYSVEQVDDPQNNEREIAIQNGFQVIQMQDQLDLIDRWGLMMAAELGTEVNDGRVP